MKPLRSACVLSVLAASTATAFLCGCAEQSTASAIQEYSRESREYDAAKAAGTSQGWSAYLASNPTSSRVAAARQARAQALWNEVRERDTAAGYQAYLDGEPVSPYRAEARSRQRAALLDGRGADSDYEAFLRGGDDADVAGLLARRRAEAAAARARRTARSEALYAAGRPALGEVVACLDPGMNADDRAWSRARRAAENAALLARLKPAVVLTADASARDLAGLLFGETAARETAAERPDGRPYILNAKLAAYAANVPAPVAAGTATGSSQYVSGSQMVPNPDKAACNNQVIQLNQAMLQAQSAVINSQAQYQACQNLYQQCLARARQGNGWGAVIAGSALCGAGDAVCAAPYNQAQNAYNQSQAAFFAAQTTCGNTPDLVRQDVYATHAYAIRTWAVSPSGSVKLELADDAPGAETSRADVADSFTVEDQQIDSEPQYNVAGKALALPGAEELAARAADGVARKVSDALDRALADYRARLLARASRADGARREDALAELLVMTDAYAPGSEDAGAQRAALRKAAGLELSDEALPAAPRRDYPRARRAVPRARPAAARPAVPPVPPPPPPDDDEL